MPVVLDITKHLKTYVGFNGEILDGINGKPIGRLEEEYTKTPNQTANPTETGQEREVGTTETEEGKG